MPSTISSITNSIVSDRVLYATEAELLKEINKLIGINCLPNDGSIDVSNRLAMELALVVGRLRTNGAIPILTPNNTGLTSDPFTVVIKEIILDEAKSQKEIIKSLIDKQTKFSSSINQISTEIKTLSQDVTPLADQIIQPETATPTRKTMESYKQQQALQQTFVNSNSATTETGRH